MQHFRLATSYHLRVIFAFFVALSIALGGYATTCRASGGGITYYATRFEQENGTGTTVYFAVIKAGAAGAPRLGIASQKCCAIDDHSLHQTPTAMAQAYDAQLAVNMGRTGYKHTQFNNGHFLVPDPTTDYHASVTQYTNRYDEGYTLYLTKGANPQLKAIKNDTSSSITNDTLTREAEWAIGSYFPVYAEGHLYSASERNLDDESEAYLTQRHPRTFIGQYKNGDYFVGVAEGRNDPASANYDSSRAVEMGLNLEEIYQYSVSQSAILNINSPIRFLFNGDGGGSSGFIYDGQKINRAYDDNGATERSLANILYWPRQTASPISDDNVASPVVDDVANSNLDPANDADDSSLPSLENPKTGDGSLVAFAIPFMVFCLVFAGLFARSRFHRR
ncbi:phosphodiester glycosidase family protein [Candidatus Saccharibacteria bacterium]|nr:phosphodiester glycosidase family protein [Candidatus Saccharibacteria bacterium]